MKAQLEEEEVVVAAVEGRGRIAPSFAEAAASASEVAVEAETAPPPLRRLVTQRN